MSGRATAQTLIVRRQYNVVISASGDPPFKVQSRDASIGPMALAVTFSDGSRADTLPELDVAFDFADGRNNSNTVSILQPEFSTVHRIDLGNIVPSFIAGVGVLMGLIPSVVGRSPLAVQTRPMLEEDERKLLLITPAISLFVMRDKCQLIAGRVFADFHHFIDRNPVLIGMFAQGSF